MFEICPPDKSKHSASLADSSSVSSGIDDFQIFFLAGASGLESSVLNISLRSNASSKFDARFVVRRIIPGVLSNASRIILDTVFSDLAMAVLTSVSLLLSR